MFDNPKRPTRALPTLLWLIAALPLPVLHATGRVLGRFIYALPGRYREHLRRNAAQAGYDDPAFARKAAGEAGAMILELARVWFRSEQSVAQVITDDWPVIQSALAEGKGIIFLTPHLGCFEVTARWVSQWLPITIMFRPHRKRIFHPLLEAVRDMSKLKAVPATAQGVRAFVRALRNGESIGLLPDQTPRGDGVWVPFFGRDAYTMTLPGKLAAQTGVPIIVAAGERLPHGRGWRVHLMRLAQPMPETPAGHAAWVNAAMEDMIRRFPEQYLWGYNRYKAPPGSGMAPDRAETIAQA